jgi:hypothetical protein
MLLALHRAKSSTPRGASGLLGTGDPYPLDNGRLATARNPARVSCSVAAAQLEIC